MGTLIERFEKAVEGLHVEGETKNIMVAISREERDEIVAALHSKNFIWNAAIEAAAELIDSCGYVSIENLRKLKK